jgi:hypothetical protein
LRCPAAPRATPPAPAPSTPAEDPEVVPTEEDLGALAHPVPVPLPTLDAQLVKGFALRQHQGQTQPLRIGMWGDSHLASGVFSGELARAIAASGARIDASYLPTTMGRSGVRLPIGKHCQSSTWRFEPAYVSSAQTMRVGPSLVDLRSTRSGAYLWLDFRRDAQPSRVVSVRVMYAPAAVASTLGVRLDDGVEQRVTLARTPAGAKAGGGTVTSAEIAIAATGGAPLSTLKLRVIDGTAVLQGFMLTHRDPAPITMDVFGLPSATVRGWAQADPAYLTDALRGQTYDAVMLEYGTNEGNASNFTRESYAAGLTRALAGMRAVFPDAACLLIGPTDRGIRIRRPTARRGTKPLPPPDLLKYARVHREITEVQAEVGRRYDCASWDWQAFMGGPAGIYSWVLSAPPRAARDLTHLTPAGYRQSAAALARALGWDM